MRIAIGVGVFVLFWGHTIVYGKRAAAIVEHQSRPDPLSAR